MFENSILPYILQYKYRLLYQRSTFNYSTRSNCIKTWQHLRCSIHPYHCPWIEFNIRRIMCLDRNWTPLTPHQNCNAINIIPHHLSIAARKIIHPDKLKQPHFLLVAGNESTFTMITRKRGGSVNERGVEGTGKDYFFLFGSFWWSILPTSSLCGGGPGASSSHISLSILRRNVFIRSTTPAHHTAPKGSTFPG